MTFYSSSEHMLRAVAEVVDQMEAADLDVCFIRLELDGQHGEFNLTIEATDDDLEVATTTAIAHRGGGVTEVKQEGWHG